MDVNKVDIFLMTNAKYFKSEHLIQIRERLMAVPDDKWIILQSLQFKDPIIMLIISVIGGEFGIDRMLSGDIGLGILKLITCGGLGIWYIIDWFLIMNKTKDKNLQLLQQIIY